MTIDADALTAYAAFAEQLAAAAGAAIRPHFRAALTIDTKADSSPVTIADRQAEQVMRELIEARYPDHGIIGEEFGARRADAELVWVLDPIDGTKSFISGVPLFGVLIALTHRGRPVVGVIDQPISGERWTGISGRPTLLNGKPVRVRPCPALDDAVLFTTSPDMFQGDEARRYAALQARVRLTRYSADCYAYALLATGCLDLVVESSLKPYDYAALIPVIEGAGGLITDWAGGPLSLDGRGQVLAAGDAATQRAAIAALA